MVGQLFRVFNPSHSKLLIIMPLVYKLRILSFLCFYNCILKNLASVCFQCIFYNRSFIPRRRLMNESPNPKPSTSTDLSAGSLPELVKHINIFFLLLYTNFERRLKNHFWALLQNRIIFIKIFT